MTNLTNLLDKSISSLPAPSELAWIEKIDTKEAIFTGQAYLFVKRVMDLALILLAMPILLPVFLAIALLIKIESPDGPVIFTQNRTGKGGKRFKMYKFRSMVPNAEELKKELAHLNELKWPDFKITNDPRVTRIGNILRRTSLDELPQLINVIKGEMSLVGPRPTSFAPDTYDLWQTVRLEVAPGLTGLWQIIGRAETEFYERLRLDIMYIKHRSLWLDVQILFRTVLAVVAQRGAH
jgi:lipopolysaccharide/colanic/teichoic acid biosynthesis glycosyltransferase